MSKEQLGIILPHGHVFVDLGPIEEANYKQATVEEVVEVIAPNLTEAKNSGVTAMVVSTPVGVGRRTDIDHTVSEAADLPLLVPTGIYREPWIPEWAHEASEAELRDWMIRELNDEIEDTGVQAAWIKVSAGDDGITDIEEKKSSVPRREQARKRTR